MDSATSRPGLGGADIFDILDNMAFTILYDTAAAGLARKIILPGQLDPLLAIVIHIRKAEHVCGQFAGRIVTADTRV